MALGLALGGLPGVLIAALIVKSLPLTAVRWLVVVAVIYAAFHHAAFGPELSVFRSPLPPKPSYTEYRQSLGPYL